MKYTYFPIPLLVLVNFFLPVYDRFKPLIIIDLGLTYHPFCAAGSACF